MFNYAHHIFLSVIFWCLDRVFSPDCSTRQVYMEGVKEVALSAVNGINCKYPYLLFLPSLFLLAQLELDNHSVLVTYVYTTASILAYGQTSSGKTYTMSGIAEYTIADIYDYIEKVTNCHLS